MGAGFIGPAYDPMNLVSKDPLAKARDISLNGVSLERLRDRGRLLSAFERFRRDADAWGIMEGMDTFGQQAMDILSGTGLVDALDLSKEDPRILERYGQNDPRYQRDGAPKMIRNFFGLVEAGARVVSLSYSRWDWHGGTA